jgi:hypothetical protein
MAGLEKEANPEAYGKLDHTRVGVLVGTGMGGLTVFQDGEWLASVPEPSDDAITGMVMKGHRDQPPSPVLLLWVCRCPEPGPEGVQEDLPLLHPLRHHKHGWCPAGD